LEKDTPQRLKLKVWAPVALGLAVLVAGAVVFAATRDPRSSYESPSTIYEIMVDQAGYDCRILPGALGILLLEEIDTIQCVPSATPRKAATIQIRADPSEVDSEVRFAGDRVPAGDEGETWIVGKNWIVELPRSSASTSEQREMAEVLGGEIFVPGARAGHS
jgi:hypothetical protein